LIAGGAIAGLAYAALAGLESNVLDADGIARPQPLLEAWGLALAPRILSPETAQSLVASAEWSVLPLLALAGLLWWVARRAAR
jgi:hypothetical protein